MEGGSLKELIINKYRKNNFTDLECSLIIKNILEGLNYLQSLNIIHRDIKPDNIMFRYKNDLNSLTICDFGFSKILDHEAELNECGTLIFMAPEQFKTLTGFSGDSWACGFIMYILCAGGLHPIYRNNMDSEDYLKQLKAMTQWSFPDDFPMYKIF